MANEIYIAVCWSCGWSKMARSRETAEKRRREHGHGDWATAILTQENTRAAKQVSEGGVVLGKADVLALQRELDEIEAALDEFREILDG